MSSLNPTRTIPIHDAGLSDLGLDSVSGWYGHTSDNGYRYLAPRETA